MAEFKGLALVTFGRNENWQDCQGELATVATETMLDQRVAWLKVIP